MSLTTLIKAVQDTMRKNVGVDGDAQRISQVRSLAAVNWRRTRN
jgi:hypothetical protein